MEALAEIEFDGSGQPSRSAPSWREGRFSNWVVILGERRFRLHKFTLAQSSLFFESSMCEARYGKSSEHIENLEILSK